MGAAPLGGWPAEASIVFGELLSTLLVSRLQATHTPIASRALTFGAAAESQGAHDVSKGLAAMLVFGAVGIGCVGMAVSRHRLKT